MKNNTGPTIDSCIHVSRSCNAAVTGILISLLATSYCQAQPNTLFSCREPELRIKFFDDLPWTEKDDEEGPSHERIETERHDFTQSTQTVGRGTVQIEAGYTYFDNEEEDDSERSHTGPELMVRAGLTENIEFRVRWDYAWQFVENGENRQGSEDTRLALKLRATDQSCWIPESALELRFTAPTGGDDWSSDEIDVGFDYIYGWRLSERAELYGSTGFSTNGSGDFSLKPEEPSEDRFVVWSQSVALGYEATDRITVYAEFYGLFTRGQEDDKTAVFYNTGVDYYLTHNFVLDLRVGAGITKDAENYFVGVGGGYRF